jgi:hypothetical protein
MCNIVHSIQRRHCVTVPVVGTLFLWAGPWL